MKKSFFSLVVFSALLIIGCQENSITDPNPVETVDKKPAGTINTGTIPLEGILVLPGVFNSYFAINGEIQYTHELARFNPKQPAYKYNVTLNTALKASLHDINAPERYEWAVTGETEDRFYVPEDGIFVFEKSYRIMDRKDGLKLVCRFLLTTDGLGLYDMKLSLKGEASIYSIEKNSIQTDTITHTYTPVSIDWAQ